MRSFIGAYKVMANVLRDCAHLLTLLDRSTAGLQSTDRIAWTEELTKALKWAQESLSSHLAVIYHSPVR